MIIRKILLLSSFLAAGCATTVADDGEIEWRARCNNVEWSAEYAALSRRAEPAALVLLPDVDLEAVHSGQPEPAGFKKAKIDRQPFDADPRIGELDWFFARPCYYPYTTGYTVRYNRDAQMLFVSGSALGGGYPRERQSILVGIKGGSVREVVYTFGMAL